MNKPRVLVVAALVVLGMIALSACSGHKPAPAKPPSRVAVVQGSLVATVLQDCQTSDATFVRHFANSREDGYEYDITEPDGSAGHVEVTTPAGATWEQIAPILGTDQVRVDCNTLGTGPITIQPPAGNG